MSLIDEYCYNFGKIGKFEISYPLFQLGELTDIQSFLKVFQDMIVLQAIPTQSGIEYLAYNTNFDFVKDGEEIPVYDCIFHQKYNDKYEPQGLTIQWKRHDRK